MTTSSPAAGRVPYNPGLFAARQPQLTAALGYVRDLVRSRQHGALVLRVTGVVNSGKTWFLQHLETEILAHPKEFSRLLVCRLTVEDFSAAPGNDGDACIGLRSLIQKMLKAQGQQPFFLGSNDAEELRDRLLQECDAAGRPLLLLLDGIDELPLPVIELFEACCLVPLALRSGVLIIMTSRRPQLPEHVWDFALRRRLVDMDLPPFDEAEVQEQLSKAATVGVPGTAVARAADILNLGGGQPGCNSFLAYTVDPGTGAWTPEDQAGGLDMFVASLLGPLPAGFQAWFEALCVLTRFDVPRLQAMFRVYGVPPTDWDGEKATNASLTRLVDTRLVHYDKAYLIDDPLRISLYHLLRLREPERWRVLHRAATALYTDWLTLYPRARGEWTAEIAYHRDCLADPANPPQVPS